MYDKTMLVLNYVKLCYIFLYSNKLAVSIPIALDIDGVYVSKLDWVTVPCSPVMLLPRTEWEHPNWLGVESYVTTGHRQKMAEYWLRSSAKDGYFACQTDTRFRINRLPNEEAHDAILIVSNCMIFGIQYDEDIKYLGH